jgi:hypothetical protein
VSAVIIFIVLAAIYLLPSIVAALRKHLSEGAIVLVNIVFGWTLLGWLIALIWALTGNTRANQEKSRIVYVRVDDVTPGKGQIVTK